MTYISHIMMSYTSDLYSAVCQLSLNKPRRKKMTQCNNVLPYIVLVLRPSCTHSDSLSRHVVSFYFSISLHRHGHVPRAVEMNVNEAFEITV